ncbi:MAG: DUF4157 domain-containing protein [Nitrosomonas sp.]|nr:DUF4157 domain-containing protein [Nitrosomonas sp.]
MDFSKSVRQSTTPRRNKDTGVVRHTTVRPVPMSFPLIQRKAACACGGDCPRCKAQTALTVSQPGDVAEIEADQIADKVMRMPADESIKINRNESFEPVKLHAKCGVCEEEKPETLKRKEGYFALIHHSLANLASFNNVLNSGGHPLDADARGSFFEPRFNMDFDHVRIHTDAFANQSARAINARAYTYGSNIVFRSGEYQPAHEAGRHLIAHELTHVVQQTEIDNQIQRDIKNEENTDQATEELLQTNSFETKWENFVWYTDVMMRSMFVEMPAYYDLASSDPNLDASYALEKRQSTSVSRGI